MVSEITQIELEKHIEDSKSNFHRVIKQKRKNLLNEMEYRLLLKMRFYDAFERFYLDQGFYLSLKGEEKDGFVEDYLQWNTGNKAAFTSEKRWLCTEDGKNAPHKIMESFFILMDAFEVKPELFLMDEDEIFSEIEAIALRC